MSGVISPEWEEALPTLDGRAWVFGLELTATQILDEAWARLDPIHARPHLFATIDPTLAIRLTRNDIVVADTMSGTPEQARTALAALAAAGVTALVARVFAPAFRAVGSEHGLVVVTLDAPSFIHTDDRLRIDLDAAKIVNLSSGDRAPIRNLDEPERAALRVALARRKPLH